MEIVTTIAPIALAILMLGLGLGLTLSDFRRVATQPKDFFVGFVCQLSAHIKRGVVLIHMFNKHWCF